MDQHGPLVNPSLSSIPGWLEDLRREEITRKVQQDPRSGPGLLLGVDPDTALHHAIEWGQADFDQPWNDLLPDDRALLYAYFLQLGHLQELLTAFGELFQRSAPESPVVIDVGCGPFTGGLALTGVLGAEHRFDYIGLDRSDSMRRLGKRLADAIPRFREGATITCRWASEGGHVPWNEPPQWRPVLVIVSYLLNSPSLNINAMGAALRDLLGRIGRGSATILYTNSAREGPNRKYPDFRDSITSLGFEERVEGSTILEPAEAGGSSSARHVRYALFHRGQQSTLVL